MGKIVSLKGNANVSAGTLLGVPPEKEENFVKKLINVLKKDKKEN
jgi:hypothetical protein